MIPIMTTIEVLLLIAACLIALPWVSYTAVKMGTAGYLRGREMFDNHNKQKKETFDE
jgi:hypothetical protein